MIRYRPFRKKRSFTLAAAIVLLALAFSYFSFGKNLFGLRSALISAFYPFQYGADAAWKGVTGFPSAVIAMGNLAKENAQLREKLNMAGAQLAVLEELKNENDRLRAGLDFKKSGRYGHRLLAAQVIGKSGYPWISVLEINRGAGAGVRPDTAVVVKEGLVGRVIEVAPFSSKVLLISDPFSSVAAADQRSRNSGVVEGHSPDTLYLKYISAGGDVKEGDKIVVSSISSILPPGIPIGTVTRASKGEADLFYEIKIKPAADFSRLEEVFLVL